MLPHRFFVYACLATTLGGVCVGACATAPETPPLSERDTAILCDLVRTTGVYRIYGENPPQDPDVKAMLGAASLAPPPDKLRCSTGAVSLRKANRWLTGYVIREDGQVIVESAEWVIDTGDGSRCLYRREAERWTVVGCLGWSEL